MAQADDNPNDADDKPFTVVAARAGKVLATRTDSTVTCKDLDTRSDGTPFPGCWTEANYVLIDHQDGETAGLYLHLAPNTIRVQPEQRVQQGQPLGTAGSTGWATKLHLHFQVEVLPCSAAEKPAYATDAQRAQCLEKRGWWWTMTVPVAFADEDVVAKVASGMPTGGTYVSSNDQPVETPVASVPTPDFSRPTQPPSGQLSTPTPKPTVKTTQPPFAIAGAVYVDGNHNGKRDGGEPGQGGVTVRLAGSQAATTQSDSAGHYSIAVNEPGLYTLTLSVPSGFTTTTPNPVSIAINLPMATVDFGIAPITAPTATPTPQPTATPRPTATARPTATPTPIVTPPVAPGDARLILLDAAHLQLSWADRSNNETGFEIYWVAFEGQIYVETVAAGMTSYTWDGTFPHAPSAPIQFFEATTDECLLVRAVNDSGASESVLACVVAPPSAPADVHALLAPPGTALDIFWADRSRVEAGFNVYYSLDGATWHFVKSVPADSTSATITAGEGSLSRVTAIVCVGVSAYNTTAESALSTWCRP